MYKRQFVVNHQSRIDDFARSHKISQKLLKDIKMKGDILVNGMHQTVRYELQQDDVITFIYPKEDNQIPKQNISLNIIYEDDYLLIIDKEKGMACIPTRSHPSSTLANALSYYYQQINLASTIHLVNRLDKETSGLMIVAKYREIHDLLCKDITHIYRRYQAHVQGKVENGIIDKPIYKDGYAMKRIIDERGKQSVTYYQSLAYYDDLSLVEFELKTGRTHQIRVHMASIGHPLIGDELYGGMNGVFDLTSTMVAFVHPVTKQIKVIRKTGLK
ncbi:MAG: RluA family pseudouridine synthase [Coprobacillus sp.]